MKAYTYLLINAACIAVPLAASFYRRHAFARQWRAFVSAAVCIGIPFILWDAYFTAKGIWGFNPSYLIGWEWLGLPIEEWLFFLCIPYACIFTYYALEYFLGTDSSATLPPRLGYLLTLALLLIAIGFWDRSYTATTALLAALFLAAATYWQWHLARISLSYLLIFPFFLLSNGVLTGSFIESPIVWYSPAENLGIRLFTIPVEDVVYGYLLIALNGLLFQKFRSQ